MSKSTVNIKWIRQVMATEEELEVLTKLKLEVFWYMKDNPEEVYRAYV